MQVYRSTAQSDLGTKFFNTLSDLGPKEELMKTIVKGMKGKGELDIQGDLEKNQEEGITYISFSEDLEGLIESHRLHHTHNLKSLESMKSLWEEQQNLFNL